MLMYRVCAGCDKPLGAITGTNGGTTRGICSNCFKAQVAFIENASIDRDLDEPIPYELVG